jgi:hypothetical protein
LADSLKSATQKAVIVQLPSSFMHDDPERAGAELLRLLEHAKGTQA